MALLAEKMRKGWEAVPHKAISEYGSVYYDNSGQLIGSTCALGSAILGCYIDERPERLAAEYDTLYLKRTALEELCNQVYTMVEERVPDQTIDTIRLELSEMDDWVFTEGITKQKVIDTIQIGLNVHDLVTNINDRTALTPNKIADLLEKWGLG